MDLLIKPSVLDTVLCLQEIDAKYLDTNSNKEKKEKVKERMGGDLGEKRLSRAVTVSNSLNANVLGLFINFRKAAHPLKANLLKDEYLLDAGFRRAPPDQQCALARQLVAACGRHANLFYKMSNSWLFLCGVAFPASGSQIARPAASSLLACAFCWRGVV
jgi:hypothetical protein